jgi:chromosome segregation ATPase
MAINKKDQNDDSSANYIQLVESLRDIAILISKTDIRLENIKTQQDESFKKIDKIENLINKFYSIENQIKIIEEKDLVIINREIDFLKKDFDSLKSYIDDINKKMEFHRSKIWDIKSDTREMKVFNGDLKEKIKYTVDICVKIAITLFVGIMLAKMGLNK